MSMRANTTDPGLFSRVDQAARGRVDGWLIGFGRRHPISWGVGRGIGIVTWRLPKRAVTGTRDAYRRWSAANTVTKTFHVKSGVTTTQKGSSPTPSPSGPGAPVATVTNINAPKQKQAKTQAKRPQTKGTGITMAQATTELSKHTAGKQFAKLASSITAFDPGVQYQHVSLVEFLDDAHTGFDRIALGLDWYATSLFELGVHESLMAGLFDAVDEAEIVMDSVDAARRRVLAIYEDIIDQETSRIGTISTASSRGGAGTGITGTGKLGAAIHGYYVGVQFGQGTEASQILADLRAAQRGYAIAGGAFDDLATRLAKAGFNAQVRDRVRRIGDDATGTATVLRRSGRTLMRLYAPQLRHETKAVPHLRVV